MSKMNQKEAVYTAVQEVKSFEDNSIVELSKDEKATVKNILVVGFKEDKIELKRQQDDLPKYVTGLLNNWLRKDERMNGGTPYTAKKPGSRKGQSDPLIKNLRILKTDPELTTEEIEEIDLAIKDRLAEIKPAKVKEVDASVIPDHLQHLIKA
jgi:hypothetical protein